MTIARDAARARVASLGLRPRQIRAQVRRWGNRSVPRSYQGAYARTLMAYRRVVAAEIRVVLDALPVRNDAIDDDIAARFAALRGTLDRMRSSPELQRAMRDAGRRTLRWVDRKYSNQVGRALGVSAPVGPETLDGWVRENLALIRGLDEATLTRLEPEVLRAFRTGARAADLATVVQDVARVDASRAMLIARDQIGKLSGQADRIKQTAAGISGYTWRTSQDERVRDSHKRLHGRRFSWDAPPDPGHPGQAIRCRCVAEPVLDWLTG